jgi:hypothetical protein
VVVCNLIDVSARILTGKGQRRGEGLREKEDTGCVSSSKSKRKEENPFKGGLAKYDLKKHY